MTDLGTLTQTDSGPELRFERRYTQPRDRVWVAITDPAELAIWFPAFVQYEPAAGSAMRFDFPPEDLEDMPGEVQAAHLRGEVLTFEPPERFSFRWADDVLTFSLADDGDGCRLVFTHLLRDTTFEDPQGTGTGWHVCLEALERLLDGEIDRRPDRQGVIARVEELHDAYATAFSTT